MKNLTKFFVVFAVATVFASSIAFAEESEWFDMEKCSYCKHMAESPGLLDHIIWENHNISNGVISVSTVDKEYLPALRKAQAKMQEVEKKLAKGEQAPMCNMCMAMSALMMKGAKFEHIQTARGDVVLMISDDPKVVAEIQNWGARTMDELKKMEAMHEHKHKKTEG